MSARTSIRRFEDLIKRFSRATIAVVGDVVADEFVYGRVERVSREAPVLILSYDTTETVPGGAGNAAMNAAALGARVRVVGIVGKDAAGDGLRTSLGARADVRGLLTGRRPTSVKTRILAGGVHSAKQQIVRIDRASGAASTPDQARLRAAFQRALRGAKAAIVSDYGSGLITPSLVARAPAPTFVDSRHALRAFSGVTACTPNESEVEAALGVRIGEDPAALERAGRRLLHDVAARAVLITRGSRGMALFEPDRRTDHIPIVGSDEIADVTGAGDTVIAVFTLAVASGATFAEAARLANYAGGIVVMKRGTATVSADELRDAVRAHLS